MEEVGVLVDIADDFDFLRLVIGGPNVHVAAVIFNLRDESTVLKNNFSNVAVLFGLVRLDYIAFVDFAPILVLQSRVLHEFECALLPSISEANWLDVAPR